MTFERECELMRQLALEAGAAILALHAQFEKIADAPADISTQADKVSQEIILRRLHREFPADRLCAEEETATLQASQGTGSRIWVVDPIDGTRGFARKNGEFSIIIGFVVDGVVSAGVVHEPAVDRLTYAVRGAGCHVRQPSDAPPKRCHVTDLADMSRATLAMSRSQGKEGEARMLQGFRAARAIQTYSAGIKMAQVARGEADVYLGDYLTLHDWDICGGHILVEEAGGKVTTLAGQPIRYAGTGSALDGAGLLASNGPLHPSALAAYTQGRVTL